MNKIYAVALLYQESENKYLFLRRKNTRYASGNYCFVGGGVEFGEPAMKALAREIKEEIGLDIPASKFKLVHTLHRKGTESDFILLCFKADITGMQPKITEPEKQDDLQWFTLANLPENIVPAHKQVMELVAQGINYSEHGF